MVHYNGENDACVWKFIAVGGLLLNYFGSGEEVSFLAAKFYLFDQIILLPISFDYIIFYFLSSYYTRTLSYIVY